MVCAGSVFVNTPQRVRFQELKKQVGNYMTDPIADILIRLKNASMSGKKTAEVISSNFNKNLLNLLADKGYIVDYSEVEGGRHLIVNLIAGKIFELRRLSKPGRRLYVGHKNIPTSKSFDGMIIISTPKGLLPAKEAIKQKVGGELICEIA